jgi:hypothetical protein
MTPFPFADAPERKKSLHENVYEFPIAQLQVLDLVVKKEFHRTRETDKPQTSRETKKEAGRVFSLGKSHPLAAYNSNHDASQTSVGPDARGLYQGCSERRIEPSDDSARSSDTGSGGKGTHRRSEPFAQHSDED